MKINLPTAEEVRRRNVTKLSIKEASIRKVAVTFLNGKLKEAINAALQNENKGVNVEVPSEAYGNEDFYTICFEELRKFGFTAEKSHDGGGLYSTLCVGWEINKGDKERRSMEISVETIAEVIKDLSDKNPRSR